MTKHLRFSAKRVAYCLAFVSLLALPIHASPVCEVSGAAHWVGILVFALVCLLCVIAQRDTVARFTPIAWSQPPVALCVLILSHWSAVAHAGVRHECRLAN
jgi:hypothetical protein